MSVPSEGFSPEAAELSTAVDRSFFTGRSSAMVDELVYCCWWGLTQEEISKRWRKGEASRTSNCGD